MTFCYKVGIHSEVNIIELYEKPSNESWNVIYNTDKVDEAYINFINIVSTLYNEYCLIRNVQQKNPLVKPG